MPIQTPPLRTWVHSQGKRRRGLGRGPDGLDGPGVTERRWIGWEEFSGGKGWKKKKGLTKIQTNIGWQPKKKTHFCQATVFL